MSVLRLTSRTSTSPISSAFCSPVEPSAAGMAFCACTTSRSTRCGPDVVRPAARSRPRAACQRCASIASSSAEVAGSAPSSNKGVSDSSAAGKLPSSRLSAIKAWSDTRLSVRLRWMEAPSSAICASMAVSQRGSPSSSSRRLRWRMAFSKSDTAAEWPGMSVVTSRSRKRRRSPAGPENSPSMAGVSQSTRR
ncbi:hypothetical protein D3C86_1717670 [compost metagenome]